MYHVIKVTYVYRQSSWACRGECFNCRSADLSCFASLCSIGNNCRKSWQHTSSALSDTDGSQELATHKLRSAWYRWIARVTNTEAPLCLLPMDGSASRRTASNAGLPIAVRRGGRGAGADDQLSSFWCRDGTCDKRTSALSRSTTTTLFIASLPRSCTVCVLDWSWKVVAVKINRLSREVAQLENSLCMHSHFKHVFVRALCTPLCIIKIISTCTYHLRHAALCARCIRYDPPAQGCNRTRCSSCRLSDCGTNEDLFNYCLTHCW